MGKSLGPSSDVVDESDRLDIVMGKCVKMGAVEQSGQWLFRWGLERVCTLFVIL